ncbi:MAG: hypothetical protein M1837_005769 [Sclerophora amabilis]|nr:MAG: hypothetical protein M1837_005769 [Sclerophora amabilis]
MSPANKSIRQAGVGRFAAQKSKTSSKPASSKQSHPTDGRAVTSQLVTFMIAIALLVLAAAQASISQLSLSPVYGAVPSSLFHERATQAAFLVAVLGQLEVGQYLPRPDKEWLPVLAFWLPTIQFFVFRQSSYLGARTGPILTEAVTYLPLVALSTIAAISALGSLSTRSPKLVECLSGIAGLVVFSRVERLFMSLWSRMIGSHLIFTRLGLQYLSAIFSAILLPSRLLLLVVPALLHSAVFNVHVPLPWTTEVLNTTLQTQSGYSILARQESLTGYISVLENEQDHFRVLRCDHSLLGGEWLAEPGGQANQLQVNEPIYAIFAILEAVRLVETHGLRGSEVATRQRKADAESNALLIGLGIGTSATALISHGINTTIVEIDPAVHEYATQFFGLPSNHHLIIDDAVHFVQDHTVTKIRAQAGEERRYDYIIHDVFTGGAEPGELFTFEFLTGLYHLLDEDGVVAINYAGDLLLPSAHMIVRTIRAVFPTCRIFREEEAPTASDLNRDFTNMVAFCTKTHDSFSFRKPTKADFLASTARKHYLLPKHEIDPEIFYATGGAEDVLSVETLSRLEEWQKLSAVGHWEIMRTVLPAAVWELW